MTQDDLYKAWHSVGADIAGLNFSDFVSYLPAQRPSLRDIKPLTEDERFQLRCQWNPEIHGAMHDYLIQQTEAAHGIKE